MQSIRKMEDMARRCNTGLKHATGLYFKVVDSDDWVNEEAYQKVLENSEKVWCMVRRPLICWLPTLSMKRKGQSGKKVMNYHTAFPKDKVFTWKDVKFFMTGQYILMHSCYLLYRIAASSVD